MRLALGDIRNDFFFFLAVRIRHLVSDESRGELIRPPRPVMRAWKKLKDLIVFTRALKSTLMPGLDFQANGKALQFRPWRLDLRCRWRTPTIIRHADFEKPVGEGKSAV